MSDVPAHLVPANGEWTVYFERESLRLNSQTKETLDALAKVLRDPSYGRTSSATPRRPSRVSGSRRSATSVPGPRCRTS